MAAFAQDSWKPTPTHGELRRALGSHSAVAEKYNQLQTLVKGEQSQVYPGAPPGLVFPGDPGVPSSLAPAQERICAADRRGMLTGF